MIKRLWMLLLLACSITVMAQEKAVVLKPGEIIPDFTMVTPEGGKIRMLETVAKAEYTLIDFWGSWCVPCRAAFPKLKQLYAKWHTKGFNIMGVADDKDEAWKKALAEDKTPWLHGRDTDRAIHKLFSVQGVPAYLLVDSKGKLVAASLFTGGRMLEFGIPIRDAAGLDAGLEKLLNEAK
ncbi:thiol-disulfide isomerase/thioredoxin [Pedobacter sp. AK017]|uniref:TlpA family protein disulfide reductase n=1 Tax=Pedobacter sp. AK017 TaxID=2723073 RepID=UPI0016077504|nr:TlpA disulfide reductase family protein [Pedobacter sp. AK017]MBB5436350.1 thiol-disulfide isomerase/thioredoxin [Pedobacter sp. AK017]